MPICCAFAGPCLYIWLNFGTPVDAELYDQYKFGCICIVVSGIIELLAEVPVFVAQVFCFVKLRIILDTLNIFVRSVIFVVLVIHDPKKAIFAFSVAQVGSTVTFVIGYYIYFIHYTGNVNKSRGVLKRNADNLNDNDTFDDSSNKNDKTTEKHSEQEDFIPFNSIKQMLPGYLHNPVCTKTPLVAVSISQLIFNFDFYSLFDAGHNIQRKPSNSCMEFFQAGIFEATFNGR